MSGSKQGETKAEAGTLLGARIADRLATVPEPAVPAPVHLWNPPDCGPLDMRIDRAGTWHHEGEPIRREALVRLFSRVLRREADGSFVLVTPVEKFSIHVEDAPFQAVEMIVDAAEPARLLFVTNVGDIVTLDGAHGLRVAHDEATGGWIPYVQVRGGLEARLTRSVAQELAGRVEARGAFLGVWSAGQFFVIGPSEEAALA
jgi:hypothetical protein